LRSPLFFNRAREGTAKWSQVFEQRKGLQN